MKKRSISAGFLAAAMALTMGITSFAAPGDYDPAQGKFVFADGTAVTNALERGVSVSKYQNQAGAIDWNAVAQDHVSFAMVRLGYYQSPDPYFEQNMREAFQAGLKTGVYYYTQALTVERAAEEAWYVLEEIKDLPVSYPVAYDVESQFLLDNQISRQQLTDQINIFCSIVAAAGYRPIVYASDSWLNNYMDVSQIPYDIWYPRQNGNRNEFPNRTIWQCSMNGQVQGIQGEVCLELSFTDYTQILLKDGWRFINGSWYYYQNYQKQTGWVQSEGFWYYLGTDGKMAASATMVIDGTSYTFGADGAWTGN